MHCFPRREWLCGAALAALLCVSPLLAQAVPGELLANGDFELADAQNLPVNWAVRQTGDAAHARAQVAAKGGQVGPRCLQLTGESTPLFFGCFAQPVTLGAQPPERLLLVLWYRTTGNPGAEIGVTTFNQNFGVAEWQTPVLTSESLNLDEAPAWRCVAWPLRIIPSARQLIVTLRIHGAGDLFVDGVSLRATPGEIGCLVQEAGLVTGLKGDRLCRVQLTNRTAQAQELAVALTATSAKGPRAAQDARVTVPAQGDQTVELHYNYPLNLTHHLQVDVTSPKPGALYDRREQLVPGLIEGHLVAPRFRAMLLNSLALPEIVVTGRLNATEELRREMQLRASLLGVSTATAEPKVEPDGRFRVTLPATGLLSGNYGVELVAGDGKTEFARLNLPLIKPEARGPEVAYDDHLRLRVDGQARFPLGIYYATEGRDLADAAAAGFNFVVMPSRTTSVARMNDAARLGLSVLVSSASAETGFWKNQFDKYGRRPELGGWYVLQRPESQSPAPPPEFMADLYVRLRALDPTHPVALALGSLSLMEAYAPCCDLLMPWTEPEPPGDLRAADTTIQHALALAKGEKPVWPVIQITGAAYSQDSRLDTEGLGRPPTPAEFRCMAYLALARGAQGLFCYALSTPSGRNQRPYDVRRDAPALWAAVQATAGQIKALSPALLTGEPVNIKYDCGSTAVVLRGLRYEGYAYLLAVNPAPAPQTVFFETPDLKVQELQFGFETGKLTGTAQGTFGDTLEPYGVRVYTAKCEPAP